MDRERRAAGRARLVLCVAGRHDASSLPSLLQFRRVAEVRVHIDLFDTGSSRTLAYVFLAQRAPGWRSPDAVPLALASEVLGGSFDSRMNHALRHEAGATYGTAAELRTFRDFGLIWITAQVEMEQTARAIRELLMQLRKLQQAPLSDEELQLAKLRFGIARQQTLSFNGSAADFLGDLYVRDAHGAELDLQGADGVDAERIRRAAALYLHPENVELGVAGNARFLVPELNDIGNIDVWDL